MNLEKDLSKEAAAAVRSYASGFRAILDFPQLGGSGAPQLEDPTMNRQQIAAGSGALPSASTRVKAEDDEEDDDLPF